MARLATVGFESTPAIAAGIEWRSVGATGASISTTTVRSGLYAGRINGLSSGTMAGWGFQYANVNVNAARFIRFYLRIATAPGAENRIFAMRSNDTTFTATSNHRVWITLDASRQLRLYDDVGVIGSPSAALNTGTWYRVEVEVDRSGANGTHILRARLDGTEFAGSSTRTIGASVRCFHIGGNLGQEANTTGDWFFDDLALNDATGTVQNSYPGDGKVVMLVPNGTDTDSGWTPTGVATDWDAVDERPPDDITSYVSSNTTNHVTEFTLTDTPGEIGAGDTVNLVEVWYRYSGAAASANASFASTLRASSGGTQEQGAGVTPANATWRVNSESANNWSSVFTLYDLPGASTTAWTKADLDAAVLGLKLTASSTNAARVTFIGLVADITPSAGPAEVTLAASLVAAPTISATLGNQTAIAASLVAAPTLTAPLIVATALAADLAAAVTLDAEIERAIPLSADLVAAVTLDVEIETVVVVSADLTATVALDGTLSVTVPLESDLAASVSLDAAIAAETDLGASLVAAVTLDAEIGVETTLAADLLADVTLAADVDVEGDVSISASLTADVTLDANVTVATTLAAGLAATITLDAVVVVETPLVAGLTAGVTLDASIGLTVPIEALLVAEVGLIAAINVPGQEPPPLSRTPTRVTLAHDGRSGVGLTHDGRTTAGVDT